MEPLILPETDDTPEVIFQPEKNIFKISRVSVPENAMQFYEPILSWIKDYSKNPNPETVFDFRFEYMNTASSKQVIQIILLLEQLSKNSLVKVRWYYDAIDEDMQNIGNRYKKLVNVDFDVIEYE